MAGVGRGKMVVSAEVEEKWKWEMVEAAQPDTTAENEVEDVVDLVDRLTLKHNGTHRPINDQLRMSKNKQVKR